jgi:hypothetical protein
MAEERTAPSGAMEGRGAYNKHGRLPASGGLFALHCLEKAAKRIAVAGDEPIVIADYGSSQGKNSLAPMRAAIDVIRARVGVDRAIVVYHEDLPSNDFNALFDVLHKDPQSYVLVGSNVFPCAIGRSFYESVLPPGHVHLGWSSYAAMWISRIPTLIPGHFCVFRSSGAVRAAFDEQGAEDWRRFLSLRAGELRTHGRLVVVVPAADEDGVSGFEDIMDQANAVLAEMVEEKAIAENELRRMVIGVWPRRRSDLLAPFDRDGDFRGLSVEDCETNHLADAAWADYELDRNAAALAGKHASFFRAVFAPTLAGALDRKDDPQRVVTFLNQLEDGLKRRLSKEPRPIHSLVETIVLANNNAP